MTETVMKVREGEEGEKKQRELGKWQADREMKSNEVKLREIKICNRNEAWGKRKT